MNPSSMKIQKGVGLIEVLVALFILAIGVLGAAAMQANALKFNKFAAERSQATFLAYEIADRMRANREIALSGGYDIAIDANAPAGDAIQQQDLQDWKSDLSNRLPDGEGSIARQGGEMFTITVDWSEARIPGADDETRGQFVMLTEL